MRGLTRTRTLAIERCRCVLRPLPKICARTHFSSTFQSRLITNCLRKPSTNAVLGDQRSHSACAGGRGTGRGWRGGAVAGGPPPARCGPGRTCVPSGGRVRVRGLPSCGSGRRRSARARPRKPSGMPHGRSVRCRGFPCRFLREPGPGRSRGGKSRRRAAAVGGSDFLDPPGQVLPQTEAVADLEGTGGAGGDALPIGARAVATGDLHSRMSPRPAAELFGASAFPERQRGPGAGVGQERAVRLAVQCEVVHPQHPGGVSSGGSGTRIRWASTVHRDSPLSRRRSILAPPRPAGTTPTASTRCCSSKVRRG
ncbi:hypothetical protein ACVW19_000487 [Streptomyces sp. TE5632]